jgi:hypothetical protein
MSSSSLSEENSLAEIINLYMRELTMHPKELSFFDTFTIGETPTVSIFYIYKQSREFTALQRLEKRRKRRKKEKQKQRGLSYIKGERRKISKRKALDYKVCSQSISG